MFSRIAKIAALLEDTAKPMGPAKTPTLPSPAAKAPKLDTSRGVPKGPSMGKGIRGIGAPGSGASPMGGGAGGEISSSSGGGGATKQAVFEEGLSPMMLGIAGGGGGYLVGKYIANPLLAAREQSVKHTIEKGHQAIAQLQGAQKALPLLGGAVGAVILATIAASRARKSEREKIEQALMWQRPEIQELLQQAERDRGFDSRERQDIFY